MNSFSRQIKAPLLCCRIRWTLIGSSSVRLKLFWGYHGCVACTRVRWLIWARMRITSCLRISTTHILSISERKRPKMRRKRLIISVKCLKSRIWAWLKRFCSIELSSAVRALKAKKMRLRRRRVPQQWAAVANRRGRKWLMRLYLQYSHSNRKELTGPISWNQAAS